MNDRDNRVTYLHPTAAAGPRTKVEPDGSANIDLEAQRLHPPAMSDINRDEVKARLEATEARMATLAEAIRADNTAARADLAVGIREIKGIGESIKSDASVFYADAARTLAEIHRAHAANKTETYALGYKVVTWVFGTLLTLTTVGLAIYKAWHDFKVTP